VRVPPGSTREKGGGRREGYTRRKKIPRESKAQHMFAEIRRPFLPREAFLCYAMNGKEDGDCEERAMKRKREEERKGKRMSEYGEKEEGMRARRERERECVCVSVLQE
jgi:hypothetical protein